MCGFVGNTLFALVSPEVEGVGSLLICRAHSG